MIVLRRFVVLLFVLTASLPCQRTWTVNGNGPADFADLPPAVAAAKSGDVIVITGHGDYGSIDTNKGLSIVGRYIWPRGTSVIHDLPKGERFQFQGIIGRFGNPNGSLLLRDNQGSVHVDNCLFFSGEFPGHENSFIKIERCRDVTFNASFFYDLDIRDSRVSLIDCGILSTDDIFAPVAPHLGTAMILSNSHVTQANSIVVGALQSFSAVAAPGIRMTGGTLIIAGDSSQKIQGGWGLMAGPSGLGPPILSNGGRVEYDPDVPRVNSNLQAVPNQGTSTFVVRHRPYVTAWPIIAPRVFKPKIHYLPGAIAGLVLGVPTQAQPISLGELWLDPSTMFPVGAGTLVGSGTEGSLEFAFPIPKGLFAKGVLLSYQAITIYKGKVELSIPVRFGAL